MFLVWCLGCGHWFEAPEGVYPAVCPTCGKGLLLVDEETAAKLAGKTKGG